MFYGTFAFRSKRANTHRTKATWPPREGWPFFLNPRTGTNLGNETPTPVPAHTVEAPLSVIPALPQRGAQAAKAFEGWPVPEAPRPAVDASAPRGVFLTICRYPKAEGRLPFDNRPSKTTAHIYLQCVADVAPQQCAALPVMQTPCQSPLKPRQLPKRPS